MNDLNYYQAKGAPASREEMYDYIEMLLIRGSYADSIAAFADLKKIELGTVSTKRTIELKPGTPLTQLKSLMRNSLTWRMVQRPKAKVQNKVPTEEAITVLRNIPLTHDNLQEFFRSQPPQYQVDLIAYHGAWDADWLLARFGAYDQTFSLNVLRKTQNMNYARRAISHVRNRSGYYNSPTDGSNLDDDTLELYLKNNIYSVVADPRISEDKLVEIWETLSLKDDRESVIVKNSFTSVATKNPNTPAWMLDAIARTQGYYYGTSEFVLLANPKLPAETLGYLLTKTRDKDARMMIAKHPNVRMNVLKKLSKSAYQPLAELATERLEEKEQERSKRRGGN